MCTCFTIICKIRFLTTVGNQSFTMLHTAYSTIPSLFTTHTRCIAVEHLLCFVAFCKICRYMAQICFVPPTLLCSMSKISVHLRIRVKCWYKKIFSWVLKFILFKSPLYIQIYSSSKLKSEIVCLFLCVSVCQKTSTTKVV